MNPHDNCSDGPVRARFALPTRWARAPADLVRIGGLGEERHELVPTPPGDDVVRPERAGQHGPGEPDELITGAVPEPVVDPLEAVEIGEEQDTGPVAGAVAVASLLDPGEEPPPGWPSR